jgi:hypothetical protein
MSCQNIVVVLSHVGGFFYLDGCRGFWDHSTRIRPKNAELLSKLECDGEDEYLELINYVNLRYVCSQEQRGQ